ncbi:MAG: hypothetical protein HEQ39_18185 [Rhizobacter sp.]
MTRTLPLIGLLLSTLVASTAALAQRTPSVAVTDLAYSERVREYFEVAQIRTQSNLHANRHSLSASHSGELTYAAGSYSYIEQGELRNFTADIKGSLLKGGGVKLIQARAFDGGAPQSTKAEQVLHQMQTGKAPAKPVRQPSVHDIVTRIKKGEFSGADYVLFGTVSSIEFRNELSPLQGSTSASYLFSLDLVSDFSVINTKTLEISAAFSAQGNGQEVKILSNRGDVVVPNRGKVIRATSLSLADSVYSQLVDQLGPKGNPPIGSAAGAGNTPTTAPATTMVKPAEPPTMVFK